MREHGFVRLGAIVPSVYVGDTKKNGKEIAACVRRAEEAGIAFAVFPELSLTGYSCGDLFLQTKLQRDALETLQTIARDTSAYTIAFTVGLPLAVDDQLFNVAAVIYRGKIFGFVPKTYIPNYKEFYERRWFSPAKLLRSREVEVAGRSVPIGNDLTFDFSRVIPNLIVGVEICEDVWMPIAPSSYYAIYGATVLANLSASNGVVAKAEYRRELAVHQSAKCAAAYVYASSTSAGLGSSGESTHDVVFDGHAMIAENGHLIAESDRFAQPPQIIAGDADLEFIIRERMTMTSFGQCAEENPRTLRRVDCSPDVSGGTL